MISPSNGAIWVPLMHVYKVVFHLLCREKSYVLDTKRFEDVFLEIFIECEARDAFDKYTGPVNIDLVE
jgi:hypothetical protein